MHDLNNLENIANNNGKDPLRGFEVAAGLYAANRVAGHMNAVESQNAAMLEQQRIQNKQLFIQNCLLQGWTMEQINEEIAAGEAAYAAMQPNDPFPWGSVLIIVLFAIAAGYFLVYGFTSHNN